MASLISQSEVKLGSSVVDVVHKEFFTNQSLPTLAQVQDVYTQIIFPEQANYFDLNEISFKIDGRQTVWTDMSTIQLEITVASENTPGNAFNRDNF